MVLTPRVAIQSTRGPHLLPSICTIDPSRWVLRISGPKKKQKKKKLAGLPFEPWNSHPPPPWGLWCNQVHILGNKWGPLVLRAVTEIDLPTIHCNPANKFPYFFRLFPIYPNINAWNTPIQAIINEGSLADKLNRCIVYYREKGGKLRTGSLLVSCGLSFSDSTQKNSTSRIMLFAFDNTNHWHGLKNSGMARA